MLIDLVAGDAREILLALSLEDWDALDDRRRFDAHIALGAGEELEWLDRFAESVRVVIAGTEPRPFDESRHSLKGSPSSADERIVERVNPEWVRAVAAVPDELLDRVSARWVDLVAADGRELEPDEWQAFRAAAADLVGFCRDALVAEDVLVAWEI